MLSVEGWSATTVGILGSGNHWTPTVDGLGIRGTVANRFIRSADRNGLSMPMWYDADTLECLRRDGPVVVITDEPVLEHRAADLDEMRLLSDPVDGDGSDDPMVARLFAEAFERLSADQEPSLVWLHVRRLLDRWDSVSGSPTVDDVGEADDFEDLDRDHDVDDREPHIDDAMLGEEPDQGLQMEASIEVPHFDLAAALEDDPDGRFRWLQRYGAQVQSIDRGLADLMATGVLSPRQVALFGTSGFQIGAGGFFGHRGPLVRTSDLHVPLVFGDTADSWRMKRIEGPIGDAKFLSLIRSWIASGPLDPASIAVDEAAFVVTDSDRARTVRTTTRWFYVEDPGGAERLYLKPDDIHDVNDVASLRDDVLGEMRETPDPDAAKG